MISCSLIVTDGQSVNPYSSDANHPPLVSTTSGPISCCSCIDLRSQNHRHPLNTAPLNSTHSQIATLLASLELSECWQLGAWTFVKSCGPIDCDRMA